MTLFGVYLLISDFLAEILKVNKNQQKASLILQYSFCGKNLAHFTKLNSLNVLPQHSQKSYSLCGFFCKHFSGCCKKNIFTAPFLDVQELHSRSNWKANVCIFL